MEILEHRALRGPNFYARFPVTYLKLDIGELEEYPSDKIPGLPKRIKEAMPTLIEHRCSEGHRGGFFERLDRGTWAGHIAEHIAIELQCLAGMEVGFGKTRETTERGIYAVVYEHQDEEAGIQAGRRAVEILQALIDEEEVDLEPVLQELREAREKNLLGPSTSAIVEAARERGIPATRLNDRSHVMLGQGAKQRHIEASLTDATTRLGVAIAGDKEWTKRILQDAGISVPSGASADSLERAQALAEELGYPVVVKPLEANHGRGITTNITDPEEIPDAYASAREHHDQVVVERYLTGKDHRILVIDGEMVAAARRDPAHVVGDGEHTIEELVDIVNEDPRRGYGHEKVLTRIDIDENAHRMLEVQGLEVDDVPEEGQEVVLKSTANLSTGGTATDVTDEVHRSIRFMAERVARLVDLDLMGIDVVAPHLRAPLDDTGGGIVEVNAGPGLRMHLEPAEGTPRDAGGPIVDMMFDDDGRIPTVAVTGTNGKTTTVRLVAHMLTLAGGRVGLASTSGVEIDHETILEGDYSGPMGARTVLREPTVTHGVLEVARGGLLRRGTGFDRCDVGILLNVGRDHIGEGDIHDLEDLTRLKATVPDVAGTAVLNADDENVLGTKPDMRGDVILTSLDPENPALAEHLEADPSNTVVTLEDGAIVVRTQVSQLHVADVSDVPLTLDGRARFNIHNCMAAVAAGVALDLSGADIRAGLTTFNPTPGQNPGRLNVFEIAGVRVLLDFAHNVPALEALDDVLPHMIPRPGGRVLRVGYLAGNRLEDDLRDVGRAMANVCDELWVSDPDPRGREEGETSQLIAEGAVASGLDEAVVHTAIDEWDNVHAALAEAEPGDLVVLQLEDHEGAVDVLRERQRAGTLVQEVPR